VDRRNDLANLGCGHRFLLKAQVLTGVWLDLEADNNSLTPQNKILLEKLIVAQLVKKCLAFHGNRRFITVFTTASHWTLPRAR